MPRIEHDIIDNIEVPDEALWGAHTQRAIKNFPATGRSNHKSFIRAFAFVKHAAASANAEIGKLDSKISDAVIAACKELAEGKLDEHIVVDPLAGGAGTSFNMNVNEVIANRANEILGGKRGEYKPVHPLDTVNMHQSTNDTFPTALRVAALWQLESLEQATIRLQSLLQDKEQEFADIVMVGRTQLQDAVPMTAGQLLGTYAEAIARDRWRIFKCIERIKIINIGGTAIGTGIGAPKKYIFKVIEKLRLLTNLPLGRAENPLEATANQDAVVEIDGILVAYATNLIKLSNDLRILSTPSIGEFSLPDMQAGSSIMPGKINPVIPEYVTQMAMEAIAGHGAIISSISAGNLQLSQFFPLAAWHLLDNLRLLENAVSSLGKRCISGLTVNQQVCKSHLEHSLSVAAALIPAIGYEKAQKAVLLAREKDIPLREALIEEGVSAEEVDEALSPARLRKLGD